MIERIIRAAARQPVLVLLLVLGSALLGGFAFRSLRRDVFPDLSAPIFNVIVQNPALGAEELETAIAIPFETALGGLPEARRIRSQSQLGVSTITVEFEPDADYFRARQLVAERLQSVSLPAGTEPPLLSSLTGRLNEVMELTLEAAPGEIDLMTLRDLAEINVQRRLLAVPGVAAVERLGGYLRQLQVQLDPDRMIARGVTLDEVRHALEGVGHNASGGLVTQGPMEWSVRAVGRAESVADVGALVVATRGSTPVLLSELADVREAPAPRRGIAHRLAGEIVSCRVVKQFGADTVMVADGVRAALDDIARGLPHGVQLRVAYDQSELVRSSLGGVGRAVLIGAGLVVLVLLGLLGDVRGALLVTATIPLSVAIAGLLLERAGVGLNTMTLGGLAIAVGLLVDASIIVVENVVFALQSAVSPADRRQRALAAAIAVARPITFATAIVAAVFLPLFSMTGIEGRMYRPLAAAVVASILAALALALTLTPVAAALVMRPAATAKVGLVRAIEAVYRPALAACMRRSGLTRLLSLALTIPAVILGLRIGTDFMPELDEGALLIQTILPAQASLDEVDRQNHRVEDVLRSFPEVEDVVRRTGRSERTEDPMPHTVSDVLVVLRADVKRDTATLTESMRERVLRVPGVSALFTTPLGMRIDEGLGGTPADLSVRIFGPDLAELARIAERARRIAAEVPGVVDLRAEPLTQLPELRIAVDRAAVARAGLTPGEVVHAVHIALAGETVTEIWRGERRFDLTLRLRDDRRSDMSALGALWIDGHDGSRIPLSQLTVIEQTSTPGSIRREGGSRRIALEASIAGRDLGSVAADIGEQLRTLQLPPGYFIDVGGRVESQARATRSLAIAVGIAVALVLMLVYMALGSALDTLVILATLPDALVGGILALWLSGETWNVSSLVGLIGLFGIAVQNGLVLVSQTRALVAAGAAFDTALVEACVGRVRPKLMTAATAILGLLPLLVFDLHGTEIERPLAIVMVGGLVTSTLFTLLALPTFYSFVHHLRERAPR